MLDNGGRVDIATLENKELLKCLKKMFKYLPLKKESGEYKKVEGIQLKLEPFMREKTSERI